MHETPLHSPKVVAWCGIASFGIYGPYLFEDGTGTAVTASAERYGAMSGNFLAPQLPAQRDIWFQQDGATVHTAKVNMDLSRTMFGNRIRYRSAQIQWPPRSPDLSAPDFFLWGSSEG
jgi:hypothetical protein